MKQYFIIPLLLITVACNNGPQQEQTENKNLLPASLVDNPRTAATSDPVALKDMATMDFKDTMHDFGSMMEDETVFYDFEFKNNGKVPLIINTANGSCGCTAAEYPRDPIEPGKIAIMKVKFNSAGKQGHQEKSVTISTNSNCGVHMLYIKADVKVKKQ